MHERDFTVSFTSDFVCFDIDDPHELVDRLNELEYIQVFEKVAEIANVMAERLQKVL